MQIIEIRLDNGSKKLNLQTQMHVEDKESFRKKIEEVTSCKVTFMTEEEISEEL